jgi:hypothetical protein
MAGDRSTRIAGQIAVARPLPVLAIDKFGGSAAVIYRELAIREDGYPACDKRLKFPPQCIRERIAREVWRKSSLN